MNVTEARELISEIEERLHRLDSLVVSALATPLPEPEPPPDRVTESFTIAMRGKYLYTSFELRSATAYLKSLGKKPLTGLGPVTPKQWTVPLPYHHRGVIQIETSDNQHKFDVRLKNGVIVRTDLYTLNGDVFPDGLSRDGWRKTGGNVTRDGGRTNWQKWTYKKRR